LNDENCYEITVEDPSYEFVNMRDEYDLRLIFNNGFFNAFRYLSYFQVITSENYKTMKLDKDEIKEISQKLKLSKSRVKFVY
jgi:hypothetical protein